MSTQYSEAYRIAEEAHKGVDNDYIEDLCKSAARELKCDWRALYRQSEAIYDREFASR